MGRTELSTRSDRVELGPSTGTLVWKRVLLAEAQCAAWRLVDLFSASAKPFTARLEWTAGAGAGAKARVTVARGTRVSVYARTLQIDVANLHGVNTNVVGVNIADGYAVTQNFWEASGTAPEVATEVEIPELATRVRLEVGDPAVAATSFLDIEDGAAKGTVRVAAADLPAGGLALGDAGKVLVTVPGAAGWRVVYELAL